MKLRLPYLGKATVAQEQQYPFLPVCAVFTFVMCADTETVAWLPVFGIFNMLTDVDTCNCTQGLQKSCAES